MKFASAILLICLTNSAQAVRFFTDDPSDDSLAHKLAEQSFKSDDKVSEIMVEQEDQKKHNKEQSELKKEYYAKLHYNDKYMN